MKCIDYLFAIIGFGGVATYACTIMLLTVQWPSLSTFAWLSAAFLSTLATTRLLWVVMRRCEREGRKPTDPAFGRWPR